MNRLKTPQILLAIAAFLAPIICGQISNASQSVEAGPAALIQAIFGGSNAPLLSHALVGILACAALVIFVVQKQVGQVPNSKISGWLVAFFGLLLVSTTMSAFHAD